jgi:proteic killer suppression protein
MSWYDHRVIRSFRCKHTESFFHGTKGRFPPSGIRAVAQRKLAQLAEAVLMDDLRHPPGNCLERLYGDREGQWSIRINQQWRICFTWQAFPVTQPNGTVVMVGQPHDVEIVDYH